MVTWTKEDGALMELVNRLLCSQDIRLQNGSGCPTGGGGGQIDASMWQGPTESLGAGTRAIVSGVDH